MFPPALHMSTFRWDELLWKQSPTCTTTWTPIRPGQNPWKLQDEFFNSSISDENPSWLTLTRYLHFKKAESLPANVKFVTESPHVLVAVQAAAALPGASAHIQWWLPFCHTDSSPSDEGAYSSDNQKILFLALWQQMLTMRQSFRIQNAHIWKRGNSLVFRHQLPRGTISCMDAHREITTAKYTEKEDGFSRRKTGNAWARDELKGWQSIRDPVLIRARWTSREEFLYDTTLSKQTDECTWLSVDRRRIFPNEIAAARDDQRA